MAQRAFGKGKATRVFLALLLAFSLVGIGAVPAAADPAEDTQAAVDAAQATLDAVSYTHLDVYKRQLKSTVEDKSEEDVLKDLKKGARKGSAYGNRKHAAYGSSRAN